MRPLVSRTLRRPGIWVFALLAALIVPGVYGVTRSAEPASAGSGLVPSAVRTDLPVALDGVVTDIEQMGNRIVVAGTFTSVAPQAGQPGVSQKFLYAYDIDTGAFDAGFDPQFDKEIEQIVPDPDGSGLWVVGTFNNIDGVKRRKIARLNADGSLDEAFKANADAKASAVAISPDGNRLFVGGQFTVIEGQPRAGLAELDANTGAVAAGWTIGIEGGIGVGGALSVKGLAVTPDSRSVMIMASAQKIGGLDRFGLAKVSIQGDTARMQNWRTKLFENNMAIRGGQFWFRGFDMSPDGKYFVLTTSGGDGPPTNDVAVRFPIRGNGSDDVQPDWITRNFDSTYSAAIDDDVVYIGGHFQYTEAPGAMDPYPGDPNRSYGFGGDVNASVLGDQVIARQQVAALDPATGHALGWNPGANGFNGVYSLEVIDRGLLLGHDGNIVADKEVGRHGFFDRNNPGNGGGDDGGGNGGGDDADLTLDTTITSPLTGQQFEIDTDITITGGATAPEGIDKVQVTVFDLSQKLWLRPDGTWGAWAGNNATLAAGAGTTSSDWTFTFTPDARGEYEIKAKTFDNARGKDPAQPSIRITVNPTTEDANPNATIVQVDFSDPPGNVIDFRGTATDDFGVASMRAEFVDRDNGLYLQPDGTVGNYHAFDVALDNPGATGVNWEYSVTLPNGAWTASFIAIDTAGQRDDSAARHSRRIAVGDERPSEITLDTIDADQEFAFGEDFVIAGTATDDIAIKSVTVRVLNLATSQGLLSTGEVGVIDGSIRHNPSELSNLDEPFTNWTFPVTADLPPGRYQVNAIASDGAQTIGVTRYIFIRSAAGDAVPDAFVTEPTGTETVIDSSIVARGFATDDNGVDRIQVGFYFYGNDDVRAGWLREADGVTTRNIQYREIDVPTAATRVDWEYPIDLPWEGRWQIRVRAWDNTGQSSFTARSKAFAHLPNDLPPTVEIENFETGAVIAPGPLALNGVLEDDVSVTRVRFYVRRLRVNEGPNPNATTTVAGWMDGFVTQPGGTRSNFTITAPDLEPGDWYVLIQGYDHLNQISERLRFDFTVNPDATNEAPVATVVTPRHWSVDTPSLDIGVEGTATDDRGVDEVRVLIYDAVERKYFGPTGEHSSESAISYWDATLSNPGGTTTDWTLPVALPNEGRYNIYAFAYDTDGMRQTSHQWGGAVSSFVGFWVTPGDVRPVNTILTPAADATIPGPTVNVTGEATDDNEVVRVRVLVRNRNDLTTGLRLDGSTDQSGQWIDAFFTSGKDTPSATWKLDVNVPAGEWRIDAIAYDATGKYSYAPLRYITIP